MPVVGPSPVRTGLGTAYMQLRRASEFAHGLKLSQFNIREGLARNREGKNVGPQVGASAQHGK